MDFCNRTNSNIQLNFFRQCSDFAFGLGLIFSEKTSKFICVPHDSEK